MIERVGPIKTETSGNLRQYLATNAWNLLRKKLELEFSPESQDNLAQLNKLLLNNSAVVYINHTSKLDELVAISLVLSQLPNAVNILGPVGMKHYDWRRDPLSAGLFRLLKLVHIQPVPVVQVKDTEVDYGKQKDAMLENLKKQTAKMIEHPGSVYGIAPEGTRNTKEGVLLRANRSIGNLKKYKGIYYLPVAIMLKKYSSKPEVVVGVPLQLQDIIPVGLELSPDDKQRTQEIADLHMKRLADLMPHSLRGAYP